MRFPIKPDKTGDRVGVFVVLFLGLSAAFKPGVTYGLAMMAMMALNAIT